MHFFGNHRHVLKAARDNHHLAGPQVKRGVSKPNGEIAAQDQKHLVLSKVPVPDELSVQLGNLHMLIIEGCNNARMPMVGEE
jgi:hypothetical protein